MGLSLVASMLVLTADIVDANKLVLFGNSTSALEIDVIVLAAAFEFWAVFALYTTLMSGVRWRYSELVAFYKI